MRRLISFVLLLLVTLAGLVWAAWGAGALIYQLPFGGVLPKIGGGLFALIILAGIGGLWKGQWRPARVALVASLGLLIWWGTILPRHDRDWIPELARLPEVEIAGERMSVSNLRNFRWRSETSFDERWETRAFDLAKLEAADVALSYWSGENIAHLIVSFVFADQPPLALSIEVRREKGEAWSAIAGFFKATELAYVAADERDLIGLRTHARGEDVRLFQLRATKQQARDVLMAYVADINDVAKTPRWYDTLTVNCTTLAYSLARASAGSWGFAIPLDYRLLMTGRLPAYLQSLGALRADMPLAELVSRSHVSERAKTISLDDPAFSAKIRESLPERMQAGR
ncbi:MAG: DUF4105 domain-containing protein [Bosea sp. (in: a-proteobacteria)]